MARPAPKSSSPAHPGIGKGLDVKFLGAGGLVMVMGLAAAWVGFFTTRGVRLGVIPIPLSIVGPLLVVGGVVLCVLAFRQERCLQCQVPLTFHSAWFPAEDEEAVLDALAVDPSALGALGVGSPSAASVQVDLDACEQCKAIAMLDVQASSDQGHRQLITKQLVQGAKVATLWEVIAARSEAHDEAAEEEAE